MKLNKAFIDHNAGEESVLVPTGKAEWSGVIRGNRILGEILALLHEETTEEAVVAGMKERFDAPEGAIEQDVARALKALREVGALDE
jgi:hypothetical protein